MLRFAPLFALLALAAPDAYAQSANLVPLLVESTGRPQTVAVRPLRADAVILCPTPCRLDVAPGPYRLVTQGKRVRTSTIEVTVPAAGLSLRVRAASKPAYAAGWIVGGFGAAATVISSVFVAGALSSAPGDSYNQMFAWILGAMAAVVALPSLVIGIVLVATNRTGVESTASPPSPAGPTLGLAPVPGGGLAVGGWAF